MKMMSDKQNIIRDLAIPFPVTPSFRQQARDYALQYSTQDTHARIYFNTLGVFVADAYFRLLGFETNLTQPERWNAAQRLWNEASELELVGLGNLECRVIAPESQTLRLPPETWRERIGYLFIEIASSEKEAVLLGFLPAFDPEASPEDIAIANLKSMDDLMDYLSQRQTSSFPLSGEADHPPLEGTERKITDLRKWLDHIYEQEWQLARRGLSTATCKKKIPMAGQVFELQLSISETSEGEIAVLVIVQPETGSLPVGMQVSVPDESDVYTETVDKPANLIMIPLEFSPGEAFWVEIQMGDTLIRENFIV
jgi:hypothetical protein